MIFLTECRDYFTSNLYESAINNNIPARTNIFSPGYNWWVAIQVSIHNFCYCINLFNCLIMKLNVQNFLFALIKYFLLIEFFKIFQSINIMNISEFKYPTY